MAVTRRTRVRAAPPDGFVNVMAQGHAGNLDCLAHITNVDKRMQMNTSEFPDGCRRRVVSPEDICTGRGSIWRN
ncbi:hypothetical protein CHELA40_11122 [Chelatococcus asaccharovorans]|nr:hypothetical protein CHELA40_11122 [Chelatococcus asaccharovorans]CAH1685379.1 hypothetical protein CHELA17_64477 [Chelatococcus asaccharovorans]